MEFLNFPRLEVCSNFIARVRSPVCHLCLHPAELHPEDTDCEYWAQWLAFWSLVDLALLDGDRQQD